MAEKKATDELEPADLTAEELYKLMTENPKDEYTPADLREVKGTVSEGTNER